ncbi:class I SAM-dependent methyltransferase [Lipingzhangella sp. LS1_29]|uniref:Class I SAM-dependent methyltransferase n=1 Tax=Lipingzhangella rawalii TaxID=2055835 RepID=A0ABU2H413_9ACTN|nr:class I SAM-dependent methyltransferase [Lipingzhangella rawalii]MDS1270043.1 class I SAM-dependent methyltransferase [Lipingzhangella rawalii]
MTEQPEAGPELAAVTRRRPDPVESAAASKLWWEHVADEYQAEGAVFLRDVGFVWGPEGLDEAQARLLGDPQHLADARVLEVGCGAAQCARWLRSQGVADVVAIDISYRQLQHSRRIDDHTGYDVTVAQADGQYLPFRDASFDVLCSAFGAYPFVSNAAASLREAARVLRPGGRMVFSTSHPIKWCFPDDPTERGLTADTPYFDRRSYVEEDAQGRAIYVEHHHTLGDWVRAIAGAGLRLVDLVEPEWPEDNHQVWGGWSPVRGRILPGTAIFVCERESG